jgi:signal transduction histidine kinase
LWNALVLLLTLALLGFIVYQTVTYRLVVDLDARLRTQEVRLETAARQWQFSGSPADYTFLNQLVQEEAISEFTAIPITIKLFDKRDGHILALSPHLQQVLLPLSRPDFEAALHGQSILSSVEAPDGNLVHVLTFPLHDKTHQLVAIAQVSQPLQVIKQVQMLLIEVLGLGSLIAVVIAYAVSFLLTNRELRPLSLLIATMHNLSVQGLHQLRLRPQRSTQELELLAEAFNQMLERLDESFALQRAFVADVSHELRTPLTAIQGQIDVLLLHPELEDGLRPDLLHIQAELRRLSRLVVNLLTSARAEAGMLPHIDAAGSQPVQLDLLLVEVARQAHFFNHQSTLEIGQLEQIRILGDADLLKQLLLNLVDNALTYTPPEGRVVLTLTRSRGIPDAAQRTGETERAEWAVLSVCDTGPGIDPEDLPHIFERYYRSQRAGVHNKRGAGLGLFIARLIAEAHGGSISVKSEPGKGACFSVWLPIAQALPDTSSRL